MDKNFIAHTNKVIDNIAQKTDSALLMCSLGKDSIVTLDLIYPKFKRIRAMANHKAAEAVAKKYNLKYTRRRK